MKFKWFRDRSQSPLDAYLATLKLYEWVQPEPIRFKCQRDFIDAFTCNLIGTWSNDDAMMPSPTTRWVGFREDGTGYVEGAFFTEYSGQFQWREKGERLIEVRDVEESASWCLLS